jgi:uncharacterized small protein (DUF1192 family)
MSDPNPNMIPWLRSLADKGGKGGVTNVDARSLGRVADRIEELESEIERLKAQVERQGDWIMIANRTMNNLRKSEQGDE